MAVVIGRDTDLCVSENRAQRLQIDAGRKQQCRTAVAKIVVADLRHASLRAELVEDARNGARMDRRASISREDERPQVTAPCAPSGLSPPVLLCPLTFERLDGEGW